MTTQIQCNSCSNFYPANMDLLHDDKVLKVYGYKCPHCGQEFIMYVKDDELTKLEYKIELMNRDIYNKRKVMFEQQKEMKKNKHPDYDRTVRVNMETQLEMQKEYERQICFHNMRGKQLKQKYLKLYK